MDPLGWRKGQPPGSRDEAVAATLAVGSATGGGSAPCGNGQPPAARIGLFGEGAGPPPPPPLPAALGAAAGAPPPPLLLPGAASDASAWTGR